ncbi:alpha/beta hydrolase [Nocardia vinacea]|uniref:alpha/beta fold hydrolase n=1 Tax=Nocardia vinacea TaxID=96468 RepID=UPI002E14D2FD|nr:alpha/beta hydrolase [Nocardia vinacea]
MTELIALENGHIACDVIGEGPLVVLSHGMGTLRQDYRDVAPRLAGAGYRVVNTDMRGHGESSMNWPSVVGGPAISRTDVANDLLDVIRHFGGPAVIVGHSLSGGAATIAAATAPELVSGIVEINPFTLRQSLNASALVTVGRYRRGMVRIATTMSLHSYRAWRSYLNVAYPIKPDDFEQYLEQVFTSLHQPGRMAEFMKTGATTPADAHDQLANVQCPALIIMGAAEPDFVDPRAEGEAIVATMPAGLGRVVMVEHGGHYPHSQFGAQVADLIVPFLAEHARHVQPRQVG